MRISKGLGFAGVGVAVGAVVAAPATASAAPITYNSTATATAGSVSIAGNQVPVPGNTVTATDSTGPQSASAGLGALDSDLGSTPLGSSVRTAVPSGANLVTETATAKSDGTSSACAAFLAGNCSDGKPQPITISLSLADLPGVTAPPAASRASSSSGSSGSSSPGSGSPGSHSVAPGLLPGLPASLPGLPSLPGLGGTSPAPAATPSGSSGSSGSAASSLAGFALVLTLSGPEAACTAGPPGSSGSGFTATQSLASASVDILDNGKSVLPGGPVSLSTGTILSQLPALPENLTKMLDSALPASPIGLTINPGSTSGVGTGPVTSATAGELALSVNGTQVLDVTGAKATCGPDRAAASRSTTTSHETPLGGGIQTDEGRSGSGDSALWPGVAAGAALGAAAGGLTLWRRRRSAS